MLLYNSLDYPDTLVPEAGRITADNQMDKPSTHLIDKQQWIWVSAHAQKVYIPVSMVTAVDTPIFSENCRAG